MTFHTLTLKARCVFYGFHLSQSQKRRQLRGLRVHTFGISFIFVLDFKRDIHDGKAGVVNGKSYDITPDILNNKEDYDFLQWDLEVGDCVFFDIRTLRKLKPVYTKESIHRIPLEWLKKALRLNIEGIGPKLNGLAIKMETLEKCFQPYIKKFKLF